MVKFCFYLIIYKYRIQYDHVPTKKNKKAPSDFRGSGYTVFNATAINISVISWKSVLLVEETEVPRENHRPAASH